MSLLAGEPVPVQVDAIEQALRELWSAGATEAESVVRAHAATLVIYTAGAETAEMDATIRRVMLQHPGRAILLAAGARPAGERVAAWVSARCHLAPGGHVCGEQVTLAAPEGSVELLPGLVAALRPPDVPAFLWWDAPVPARSSLFSHLAGEADRVLVESGRGNNVPAVLARVRALQGRRQSLAAGDLSWTRTRPWRELVAQLFDPPACRALLAQLDRVELDAGGGRGRVEARLVAGWLASRLKWSPVEWKRRLSFAGGSGDGEGLRAVRLVAGEARLAVERAAGEHCARVTVERPGEPPQHRAVALPPRDTGELLCEELDLVGHDRAFDAALDVAARLSPAT